MKVVVSDTSPIRALNNLGLIDLLRELYAEVVVPTAVDAELRQPRDGEQPIDLSQLVFISIRAPSSAVDVAAFRTKLDPGESEALALAVEMRADLILMDEKAGRSSAGRLGITTTGTFGVLVEARRLGLVAALAPLIDRLRDEHRFFVTPEVRARVLLAVGESS